MGLSSTFVLRAHAEEIWATRDAGSHCCVSRRELQAQQSGSIAVIELQWSWVGSGHGHQTGQRVQVHEVEVR